jgi:hypothetical protein
MKITKCFLFVLLMSGICTAILHAQSTITTSGGNATGSGGSVSYTVGQILYSAISGSNGTVVQGVQQPYEISVVTAIASTENINLRCVVYPNPTSGLAKLVFESDDYENLSFRLYDVNGAILQVHNDVRSETELSLENQSAGIYFLHIMKNNLQVKVFKIIKQ